MSEDETFLKAKAKFKTSHMSNSKWRKLFMAIATEGLNCYEAEWNFIDDDHVWKSALPDIPQLNTNRFNDGRFQPFEYKWIKSIFVPNQVRIKEKVGLFKKQDTDRLFSLIETIGKYKIEKSAAGITICGYD